MDSKSSRGRKSSNDDNRIDKKKRINRNNQRNYKERQKQLLINLNSNIQELEQLSNKLKQENNLLKRENDSHLKDNEMCKQENNSLLEYNKMIRKENDLLKSENESLKKNSIESDKKSKFVILIVLSKLVI
ncbi:2540_t:CDS:1 [Scutellospora calospora]|uniref:2540_t:CDS:1 n=1 Tax=Scutellospora calospora TaxID=85575 RepID=A0ACA9LKT6_9GLOM|nr:2540_t:CDS:1 [Scutellospora calospora]